MKLTRTNHYLLFILLLNISCGLGNTEKISDSSTSNVDHQTKITKAPCYETVENIIVSSKIFTELTKGLNEKIIANGGSGYLLILENNLELTENNLKGRSIVYEYSLRENYPDRAIPIAKFVFDPNQLELYQENMSEETLTKIDFEKKLLTPYLNQCK